jgi:hypothetical protein
LLNNGKKRMILMEGRKNAGMSRYQTAGESFAEVNP